MRLPLMAASLLALLVVDAPRLPLRAGLHEDYHRPSDEVSKIEPLPANLVTLLAR